MQAYAREHVGGLTAALSVVSLALVFGAVLGYLPEAVLPRIDPLVGAIPHINAAISATAIVTIATGVRAIRRRDIETHRKAMLLSACLFALFLILYLYRVALEGPTEFTGPDMIYQYVYLPMLAIHILFAIVAVPLVYYVLLLATTRPPAALSETRHARVGRVAASLWLVSFALGICVWLSLHVLF
jgi:putative membrane protein